MELSLVDKMTFEISGIEIDWAKKRRFVGSAFFNFFGILLLA